MVQTLLHVLREQLTGIARRVRALALRFVRRSQPAQDDASVKTTPIRKFEPQATGTEDAASGGSGWRGLIAMGPLSRQAEGPSEGFQSADNAEAGVAVTDRGQAVPEEEALAPEDTPQHDVKSDVPFELRLMPAEEVPQPHTQLGPDAGVTPNVLEEAADKANAQPLAASELPLASPSEPLLSSTAAVGEVPADTPAVTGILAADLETPSPDQAPAFPESYTPPAAAEEILQVPLGLGESMTSPVDERTGGDVSAVTAPAPPSDREAAPDTGAAVPLGNSGHDVERLYGAKDKSAVYSELENIAADRTPVGRGDTPPLADTHSIDEGLGSASEVALAERASDLLEPHAKPADRRRHLRRSAPPKRRRARAAAKNLKQPALVSAPPIEDIDYRLWNLALAKHCLSGDESNEALYLTITPTILSAALGEVQPVRRLPEDAEAAFVRAVTEVYHGRVIGHREKLRVLRRCGPDGLPDCIAFLAAGVLAAYHMRSDEETVATAYYARLAELLKCDLVGGHPRGFDPDEFEALWLYLERWLRTEKTERLAMPGPDSGVRRFIALPLTHVPLRRVDIDRLPEFFAWAGYEPGTKIARSNLDQALTDWCLGRSPFTNAGMAALVDERRDAVLAQIAHELESWDGSHTDSLGRRSGRVEILLDIVQRRPELFYLPRRPAAFPQVFDDGIHTFEASDEGWYDPVPIPSEDGRDLAEGFEWQVAAGRLHLTLRRPGVRAIALPASSEYTGYLSHRALQLGAPSAVLCVEALTDLAAEYLSAISGQRCSPLNLPGLPEGWRLFTGIKPHRRGEAPPAGLEALAVQTGFDLIPRGGLRLGSRWAWLAGAPPRLIAAGLEVGEQVTVDGQPVAVAEDGMLAGGSYLTQPGTHIIEAAGRRQRIEMVEPQIRSRSWEPDSQKTTVALPRGSWTLVGAIPGEVAVPTFRSSRGAVAWCTFSAVWAVESAAGPGARIICLSAKPHSPGRVQRLVPYGPTGRSLWAWASAIYNAAMRRPHMEMWDRQECGSAVRSVWTEYVKAARAVKRQLRRTR